MIMDPSIQPDDPQVKSVIESNRNRFIALKKAEEGDKTECKKEVRLRLL